MAILHKISLISLGLLLLSGCYQPEVPPRIVQDQASESTLVLDSREYWLVGYSVQGRPIMAQTLGNGPETVLVMATIHGNEPAGTPLVGELSRYLKQNPQWLTGKRVILIRITNPDGLHANTRANANGIDLNRNFVTSNRINNHNNGDHGLSEPEAVALKNLILRYRPQRIISLHQPLECIDYDGPGAALAQKMAKYCPLPVHKLGARPGSLGSYAGETLGVPIITFEMRKQDTALSTEQLWRLYGRALLAGIEG